MNHQEYIKKILDELGRKYEKEFEVVQATYEVSGNGGNFYRAVCAEKESGVRFASWCYLNGSDYQLPEEAETLFRKANGEPTVLDEYCVALLNKQFAAELMAADMKIKFAIADTKTASCSLTIEDLSRGVQYCLSNDALQTKATVYLFITEETNRSELREAIIQHMTQLNLSRCNVDIAFVSDDDLNAVINDYAVLPLFIDSMLANDPRVSAYTQYAISREKGVTYSNAVKGD